MKYIDLPLSNYSTWPNDRACTAATQVGVSTFSGYSYNERSMLSLAIVDAESSRGGGRARLGRGGRRLAEARRRAARQMEIRAVVSPCPYAEVARTSYAAGWRTQAAV